VKVAIILNGISSKKKFFYKKIAPLLTKQFSITIFETRNQHDATVFASRAAQNNFDVVLAAGGDGTLNQVLNGLMLNNANKNATDLPILGVIPLGSGNDFARTISMRAEATFIADKLNANSFIQCDVGRIVCKSKSGDEVKTYFINVADAGMGPVVVEKVMKASRILGAGFAYYKSILATFFSYKPMKVFVKTETWNWEGNLRTLAIANGQCFGHGLYIAPKAKPDDGVFSTFIAGGVTVAEFIWHSEKLKRAKRIKHPNVDYNEARNIEIESTSACTIEADGEWIGYLPAKIEILPSRIKFLC
jgi:YegS/Rv2252/BmrU family lipid kinase